MVRQTTCLMNQWANGTLGGKIQLSGERRVNARQIANARYDEKSDRTSVSFYDGKTIDLKW